MSEKKNGNNRKRGQRFDRDESYDKANEGHSLSNQDLDTLLDDTKRMFEDKE